MGAREEARDAASAPEAVEDHWTWHVEPPDGWFEVPVTGTVPADDLGAWERGTTSVIAGTLLSEALHDVDPGGDAIARLRDQIEQAAAESVTNLREFADAVAADDNRILATAAIAGTTPVPVLVAVGLTGAGDDGTGLLAALGASGGSPLEPPNIEYPDLPDGDGVRVTRFDLGDSGTAWLSVALGRRTEHADVVADTVLVWRSQDLDLAGAMTDLLDQLLPAVTITRSTT